MEKLPPNFLFPTNFRNSKNIKRLIKDFSIQGYGIAIYLLETLAETVDHKYPINDIDLLSDEMKVSVPVINTVISSYGLFEIIEEANGNQFISLQLNKWLEPYYIKVDKLSRAGKISALKKELKKYPYNEILKDSGISKRYIPFLNKDEYTANYPRAIADLVYENNTRELQNCVYDFLDDEEAVELFKYLKIINKYKNIEDFMKYELTKLYFKEIKNA